MVKRYKKAAKNPTEKKGFKRKAYKKQIEKKGASRSREALLKSTDNAAKKRGFSLFTWIRRDSSKKPLCVQNQSGISQNPKKEFSLNAPHLPHTFPLQADSSPRDEAAVFSLPKAVTLRAPNSRHNKYFSPYIKNPVVTTDFDKVLQLVNDKGVISAGEIKKSIGIDGPRLKECYIALEKAGAVRVEYPLFGPPKIISAEYEKEKKRKELLKKGIEPDYENADA